MTNSVEVVTDVDPVGVTVGVPVTEVVCDDICPVVAISVANEGVVKINEPDDVPMLVLVCEAVVVDNVC